MRKLQFALLAGVLVAGIVVTVYSAQDDAVTSEVHVRITADRQQNGDLYLGLQHVDGRVISPGEDSVYRAAWNGRRVSSPISVTTSRDPLMDSERVVRGVGEEVRSIAFSEGLWLCSTTFNEAGRGLFGRGADFTLIIGDEQFSDPTVGSNFAGSGTPFLIAASSDSNLFLESVAPNVEHPVTPIAAHGDHVWELYCNKVQHR